MSALAALAAARTAGVRLSLDGNDIIAEASSGVPSEVVEAIRAAKPDLVRVLRQHETATEGDLDDRFQKSDRMLGACD
jgi:hypothetical protein